MFKNKNLIFSMFLILLVAVPLLIQGSESDRGSTKMDIADTTFIDGKEIVPGKYNVTWEFNSSGATVMFKASGKAAIELQGKTVDAENKSQYDRVITGVDSSGRQVLKALQFRGQNFRIVFE